MELALDILTMIGVVGSALWAATTFWLTRRRELAFHRTEFIVEQSQYLDNDPEMRECTLLLFGKHKTWTIEHFVEAATADSPSDGNYVELQMKFEKYLNFMWRIAYAHYELRTLERKDLDAFGAYFDAVGSHAALRGFCRDEGYDEIVRACDDLDQEYSRLATRMR
jgi:hypothetical protein